METTVTDQRAEYIDGLRQIADFLESHPDVGLPYIGSSAHRTPPKIVPTLSIYVYDRDEFATVARALGHADKSTHDGTGQFYLTRTFAGIDLVVGIDRDEVCDRVVTGTREVETEGPDPEVVAALPRVKRIEVVEDVEWRCHPLLAEAVQA